MMSVEGVVDIVLSSESKSKRFIKLYDAGLNVSEISKVMDSVYSFVYGVIDKYTEGEVRKSKSKEGVWSTRFKNEWEKGRTIGEIANMFNKNYSYVWTVIDKHRKAEKE